MEDYEQAYTHTHTSSLRKYLDYKPKNKITETYSGINITSILRILDKNHFPIIRKIKEDFEREEKEALVNLQKALND